LIKSPFLYLGILVLIGASFFAFSIQKAEESSCSERNVFDDSHYLFPAGQRKLSFDLNVLEGSVLEPTAPPFLVSGKTLGALTDFGQRREIERYNVQQGDTLTSIAEKFDISLETLLWANNLSSKSVLKVGQELTILPITGLIHVVREGDTLSEIVLIYEAELKDIVEFNLLGDEEKIYAGDFLMVPYGKKPKAVLKYTQVPLSQSYFICPVPSPCRITQGLHWYNAVDFGSGKCGEPVYAAAGGVVQRTGYTDLGGSYVRIQHPNGVVTYYGHLSKAIVSSQQTVYQGQIIGYVGYSGVTSPKGPAGCHLHFDVRFAENPFGKYSSGTQLGN